MSERKWHAAGATGVEQAFIDGRRYTVAPSLSVQGGFQADGQAWFATRAEAKAACHGMAVALREDDGVPTYAEEVPSRWLPQRYTRICG